MATLTTWVSAILAGLGVVSKLLDLFKQRQTEQAIKTEQENKALARQVAEGKKSREIEDQARVSDLDAMRDRMRKYQRPGA